MERSLILWGIPLLAFLVGAILHLVAWRVFPALGLLDFPKRYKLKRAPIPYPSGIMSVVSFLLFFLILEPITLQTIGVLIAIGLIGICAFIDDRYTLSPWLRLLIQILIAVIVFTTGTRIYSFTNPLEQLPRFSAVLSLDQWNMVSPFGPLPVLSGLFTVGWLTLTMNALNWFDGISGQVSSLSVVGFLTLGLLSLSGRVDQPELALLSFTLAAIAAASLVFDWPPPAMVLGDTGAMFFGCMLGILTIYAGGKVATAFLVLGVPLIDSLIVILRRITKGVSPFRGNTENEHLHHRLLKKKWKPWQIILLTTNLGGGFGLTALFLSTLEKVIAAGLLAFVMLVLSWYSHPSKS